MKRQKLIALGWILLFLMKSGKNMNNELKKYRHGDLALIGIEKLPSEHGVLSDSLIIMKGSHGNNHVVANSKIYLKNINEFVFGYIVAEKNCVLFHVEHGEKIPGKDFREAHIDSGIYELRKQCEDTHDGMRQVVD